VAEYVVSQASRFTIDFTACKRFVKAHDAPKINLVAAAKIYYGDWNHTQDEYGRLHTPFTQLWKPLRNFIDLDGEWLVNLDIRNSQIVFLVRRLLITRARSHTELTEDEQKFVSLVQSGQIYDVLLDDAAAIQDYLRQKRTVREQKKAWREQFWAHICGTNLRTPEERKQERDRYRRRHPIKNVAVEIGPVNRDNFKELLFAEIFFGKGYTTPLTKLFDNRFPAVWAFIRSEKRGAYQELARNMQRDESHFMFGMVCKRLKQFHPQIAFITIHDSFLTPRSQGDTIRRIMLEEFGRFGMKPTIRCDELTRAS
jgi:hypothetical protein